MTTSILLVDSLESYRSRVADALRELGFEVVEAGDSEGAADAILAESFAAAVVDGGSASGRGLVARIRQAAPRSRILLVVPSELDAEEDGGADRLLRGPLHPVALAREAVRLVTGAAEEAASRLPEPRSKPPADDGADAEEQLREVRRQYGEKLPDEIDKLRSCCRLARQSDEVDYEALREIKRLSHTIHGTAGTLGFGEVGSAMSRIESIAARCLSGEGPTEENWRGIDEELERARTAPGRISLVCEAPVRASEVATVLVVDDDPEILASVDLLARRNLVRAICAENPEQALLRAGENELDGAIIDIKIGRASCRERV